jgi:hypothetical protein
MKPSPGFLYGKHEAAARPDRFHTNNIPQHEKKIYPEKACFTKKHPAPAAPQFQSGIQSSS